MATTATEGATQTFRIEPLPLFINTGSGKTPPAEYLLSISSSSLVRGLSFRALTGLFWDVCVMMKRVYFLYVQWKRRFKVEVAVRDNEKRETDI
jgi:hypothetical protein